MGVAGLNPPELCSRYLRSWLVIAGKLIVVIGSYEGGMSALIEIKAYNKEICIIFFSFYKFWFLKLRWQ